MIVVHNVKQNLNSMFHLPFMVFITNLEVWTGLWSIQQSHWLLYWVICTTQKAPWIAFVISGLSQFINFAVGQIAWDGTSQFYYFYFPPFQCLSSSRCSNGFGEPVNCCFTILHTGSLISCHNFLGLHSWSNSWCIQADYHLVLKEWFYVLTSYMLRW
jgi:hypothetical protein